MKKRYENITLNGINFIYDKIPHEIPYCTRWNYCDIFSAYERPSQAKINIWEYWYNWMCENCKITNDFFHNQIFVCSKNTHFFTISGSIVNRETGEILGIYITPTKNICWSISE